MPTNSRKKSKNNSAISNNKTETDPLMEILNRPIMTDSESNMNKEHEIHEEKAEK